MAKCILAVMAISVNGCATLLHPEDFINMFSFLALSVFNFYVSMSELFMQDMLKREPKVESDNELRSKRWVLWSYLRTSRTCSVDLWLY